MTARRQRGVGGDNVVRGHDGTRAPAARDAPVSVGTRVDFCELK